MVDAILYPPCPRLLGLYVIARPFCPRNESIFSREIQLHGKSEQRKTESKLGVRREDGMLK